MDIGTRAGRDRAAPFDDIRARAGACTDCDLWKPATATVFGEGPVPASLMLMGEQPGDHEDREGRPFVGPAGKLLDEALTDASIDRSAVYLTNAVKHFKFVKGRNGKTRIHKTPTRTEVAACRQWWELELEIVQPAVLGCSAPLPRRPCSGLSSACPGSGPNRSSCRVVSSRSRRSIRPRSCARVRGGPTSTRVSSRIW
jgi:uracil-DNA glycosylase family protein